MGKQEGESGITPNQSNQASKAISISIVIILATMTTLSGSLFLPTAQAAGLALSVGNVDFSVNDFGVITNDIAWNWVTQSHFVYKSFLTIYHSAYPSGGGRERNIAVDAGHVLRLITQLDVDFVFSGHKHLPWVWKLENTYFVTAGTASSQRLKGRSHPSFNIMNVEDGEVVLDEINVADSNREEILRVGRSF